MSAKQTILELNALESTCASIISQMDTLCDQVITRARSLRNHLAAAEILTDTQRVANLSAAIAQHDALAETIITIITDTQRVQKTVAGSKSDLLFDLLNSGSAADQAMAKAMQECQGEIGGEADDAKFQKRDQPNNTGPTDEDRH
jgi:hypothetical protein